MSEDLYTRWLGVPAGDRPPDHYALLGVECLCDDLDAIESAARRRMEKLDEYALHPDPRKRQAVQRMMNEVARARVCLVSPWRKRSYDIELAERLGLEPPVSALPEVEAVLVEAEPQRRADPAEEFAEKVRAHLLKWRLTRHEEIFLLAVAQSLGLDDEGARGIMHQVDAEAETAARATQRLWSWVIAGAASVGILALVLFLVITGRVGASLDRHKADAWAHLKARRFARAVETLRRAERLDPKDENLATLRDAVAGEVQAEARRRVRAGKLTEAEEMVALLRQVAPNHPLLPDLMNDLARLRSALGRGRRDPGR